MREDSVNNRANTGQYQRGESGNPDGRPKGAKNKRTLIRDALAEVYDDGEAGFWLAVAEKAKAWDTTAVSMLGARLSPPLKAMDSPVHLDGLEGSLTEKAGKIIEYMGRGEITPSEASGMVNAIASLCRVQEIEELAKRLDILEQTLKSRK